MKTPAAYRWKHLNDKEWNHAGELPGTLFGVWQPLFTGEHIKRLEELENMLARLVQENDLAMPNENYQWMCSPMRVECLKLLENK